MGRMPRFSIIVVHYQGTVSREIYLRGINSVLAQTFKDFEVLVYHDGPLVDPAAPTPVSIRCTPTRHNDWGHSLRDLGIREATGDHIVHFNADNLLYPDALETLTEVIRAPHRVFDPRTGNGADNPGVIVFPIIMHDYIRFMDRVGRLPPNSGAKIVMTGDPPVVGNIDCMQLVMSRKLWLAEGGWQDKAMDSDGRMYKRFMYKYGYRSVGKVLGEHF